MVCCCIQGTPLPGRVSLTWPALARTGARLFYGIVDQFSTADGGRGKKGQLIQVWTHYMDYGYGLTGAHSFLQWSSGSLQPFNAYKDFTGDLSSHSVLSPPAHH
jgi:hypothetical protein